jgi:hypothetical protein
MLIVRNSVRLGALVAALALAGCGSASGYVPPQSGDCSADRLEKGCVTIMNWRSTAETFAGYPIAAKHANSGDRLEPGLAGIKVSDTSLNSTHTFQGKLGGQDVSVTCTVTSFTWTDVNPEIVIQQEALGPMVNCSLW